MALALSRLNRELLVVPDVAEVACQRIVRLRPRTLALVGGRTPRALYRRLADADLPWAEMDIGFGDERCVPPSDERSNYRMAYDALLSRVPARVHRMCTAPCDGGRYEAALRELLGPWPVFDLVLLGLGADGHTASLFPGDPALDERQRWVVAVDRPDGRRLTLTLPVLSAARTVLFLVTGPEKRTVLAALMRGDDVPAARVEARNVVVVADRAAAGGDDGGASAS